MIINKLLLLLQLNREPTHTKKFTSVVILANYMGGGSWMVFVCKIVFVCKVGFDGWVLWVGSDLMGGFLMDGVRI